MRDDPISRHCRASFIAAFATTIIEPAHRAGLRLWDAIVYALHGLRHPMGMGAKEIIEVRFEFMRPSRKQKGNPIVCLFQEAITDPL